jgi:putative heme iron utilization protein
MSAHWIFIFAVSCLMLSAVIESTPVQQNDISTDIPRLVTVHQVPNTSLVLDALTEYVMESAHSKVHLILRPNKVLISPVFSVDVRMAAGEHRVGWNASTKRFMYLHGHVRTDAASMVAVQLQLEDKKMNGLIAFGGRSYWIEPTSEERYHLLKPLPVQTEHREQGGSSTEANSIQS